MSYVVGRLFTQSQWKCITNGSRILSRGALLTSSRQQSTLVERLRDVAPRHYVMLVFPAITFYLGVWQVKRRKWKIGLIEELERKSQLPAVTLPLNLSDITPDREYETFILEGEFDHSRETFVGPRVLLDPSGSGGGLISSGGTTGVHVVTPLKLAGRNEEVLVNRGWISRRMNRERRFDRPRGKQRIEAVYRNPEMRSAEVSFDERTGMWSKRCITMLAKVLGTSECFFDMSDTPSHQLNENSPIPGQTNIYLRNEHMSYIFTWFTLTVLTLIIWVNRHLRDSHTPSRLLDMVRSGRGGRSVLSTKKR